ncbi:unnamed protein product [Oncorhynchus mykiss]|uniref:polypeptide N-acetylgalactosaminyltransferase n=1 Tax=Oncorhynchus mykiss TaxID=8022 RepID=A0A060W8R9_ONCMY|nr:unnamed protein product [Oncorhynchus mykiss]
MYYYRGSGLSQPASTGRPMGRHTIGPASSGLGMNVYYTNSHQLHLGVLSPTIDDDDNKCLVDVNNRPRLLECSYATAKRMKLAWLFTQGGSIENMNSKRCLELVENGETEFGYQLAIQKCSGQKWTITNLLSTYTLQ